MILGITGAFGCGKSSVLAVFSARGWRTADADRLCHELYAGGSELAADLVKRWGAGILLPSGEVDRRRLASIVFEDQAELDALTALLYPRLAGRLDLFIDECRRDGTDAAIEIPLLYEAGLDEKFDAVAAVWSAPDPPGTAPPQAELQRRGDPAPGIAAARRGSQTGTGRLRADQQRSARRAGPPNQSSDRSIALSQHIR